MVWVLFNFFPECHGNSLRISLLQPAYIKGNLTDASVATNFDYCSLHNFLLLTAPLKPFCFFPGIHYPLVILLFWVSVFDFCALGQMLLLAPDSSAPRQCEQLEQHLSMLENQNAACAKGYHSVLPPQMSFGTRAPALHIYCPLLNHFLSAVEGVSDGTARGSCTDLAKDSPKFYPLEYFFGLLKLTLPLYTWIKLHQTKSALIFVLFQLHFMFLHSGSRCWEEGELRVEQQLKIQVALCSGGKKKGNLLACWGSLYLPKAKRCLQSQLCALGRAMGRQRLAPWWHLWDRGWWPPGTCCCCLPGCAWHRPKARSSAGLGCITSTAPWILSFQLEDSKSITKPGWFSWNIDLAFQCKILLSGACFHDSLFAATLCYTFGIQAINL